MENPASLKILFVINPISGRKKNFNWQKVIRDYFQNLPHIIEFYVLSGKDDTGSLDYWIEKLQVTRVVAVGGDGTVGLIAKQLLGKDVIMGILPAGSANGMAKELRIPETPEEALDIIINGTVKCCDVIKINEKNISLHLSDLGLNARLVKYFAEGPLRGMWGYTRLIFKVLWKGKLMNTRIVADNVDVKTSAYMIVIANASKYGTGAVINPEGNIGDGVFEIVIVRKLSLLELFKMFVSYKNFNPEKVEVFQTKTATITTVHRTHFQVDGEYKGRTNEIKAVIMPSQLNLLIRKVEG